MVKDQKYNIFLNNQPFNLWQRNCIDYFCINIKERFRSDEKDSLNGNAPYAGYPIALPGKGRV
jgi:hypothetical protein